MQKWIVWFFKIVVVSMVIMPWQACEKEYTTNYALEGSTYKTENVIVVIIDGPRFSETWGHPEKAFVPFLANNLSSKGIVNQEFYNFGLTKTISGHTAAINGVYEIMNNNGLQYPSNPSFMQYWLKKTNSSPDKAWIISSKIKLKVLGNSSDIEWRNSYLPSVDAEDRTDEETFESVKKIMTTYAPNLIFVNLSQPDRSGHANNWEEYIKGIILTDSLLNEIVGLADSIPSYMDKTTVFMTNDHGRHLDGISNGFIDHGDKCHGCTHLNFYAQGPDFHSNLLVTKQLREQIDIVPTIGRLLGLEMDNTKGNVMTELFK